MSARGRATAHPDAIPRHYHHAVIVGRRRRRHRRRRRNCCIPSIAGAGQRPLLRACPLSNGRRGKAPQRRRFSARWSHGEHSRSAGLPMFEACCHCSLTPAPRPIQGPLERCACCHQPHDGGECDVERINVCVVCGVGPMCGYCANHIPYRCCKCFGGRDCIDAAERSCQDANHVLYSQRLALCKEVSRTMTFSRSFRHAWQYISATGMGLGGPQRLQPPYRTTWELLHFHRWSVRVLIHLLGRENIDPNAKVLQIVLQCMSDALVTMQQFRQPEHPLVT